MVAAEEILFLGMTSLEEMITTFSLSPCFAVNFCAEREKAASTPF